MKIVILGDSHDHYENLQKAVDVANSNNCELMLHTGDLGAPGNSVEILKNFKGQIKMILGNNDHEIVGLMRKTQSVENFEIIKTDLGGDSYEDTIDGIRIFMHHYPRIAELAAASGEFDLCICGHTHEYREEMVGNTLLINPSSIIPNKEPAGVIIYNTSTKKTEHLML